MVSFPEKMEVKDLVTRSLYFTADKTFQKSNFDIYCTLHWSLRTHQIPAKYSSCSTQIKLMWALGRGHPAVVVMYSAHCRRPWGTFRTDPDDDQDLAKLRRKRESPRGQREERGEQDYSCPSYECGSVESKIIPVPAMDRAGGGGGGRATLL